MSSYIQYPIVKFGFIVIYRQGNLTYILLIEIDLHIVNNSFYFLVIWRVTMDYFIDALKQYANFNGRARRKEYWMFILVYMIINMVLAVLGLEMISMLVGLILLIPSISIATRRLHDTGRTGWWQLIILIPIIGLIVLIVFLVQDSHDTNDYGVNPKLDTGL
mgnify:CR=1 FL=1